jgi:hypothetical protein|tara:strand:+ start:33 stop:479 length:447 start_codon:yes stop_codon:yes gene_type:complete
MADQHHGAENMKVLVAKAFSRLDPHCQHKGHPAWMLNELLKNVPVEGECWDLFGHTMFSSRAVGMPPATAGCPGKQLIAALYLVYCEEKGPTITQIESEKSEQTEEQKQKRYEGFNQWKDTSALLSSALIMMFQKMEETLRDASNDDT